MKHLINRIISSFVPALPLGDELGANDNQSRYTIYPLKGESVSKSYFQRELERASTEGKWKPKILLLPNVGKFEIELNAYNAALLANGILARMPSKVKLYHNRNRKMNRYLIYSYWRLYSAKYENHKYWYIAINLIRNSSTYLTVCLHTVDRNLYRKMEQKDLVRLIKRLNNMRANMFLKNTKWQQEVLPLKAFRHYVKFYRVYIPKGSTYRPLGVPTRAWRIYMKMWLMPIVGATGDLIPDTFHGYLPKRGTTTAWKEILTKVIHKQNIYEVDFKQFFPSIPSAQLSTLLFYQAGIPGHIVRYLHLMNQSLPMFMEKDLQLLEVLHTEGSQRSLFVDQLILSSTKPLNPEKLLSGLRSTGIRSHFPQTGTWPKGVNTGVGAPIALQEFTIDGKYPYSFYYDPRVLGQSAWMLEDPENFLLDTIPNGYEIYTDKDVLKDKADLDKVYKVTFEDSIPGGTGLPQGSPLSPYLSILYLEIVLDILNKPEGVDYLFYADDGIFYCDDYNVLNNWLTTIFRTEPKTTGKPDKFHGTLKKFNIIFHPDKSGWVKKNGEWLRPLKFLGLTFTYGTSLSDSTLRASTRPKQVLTSQGLISKFSTLLFDKTSLVFYDYSKRQLAKAEMLNRRIKDSRSFAISRYWKTLLQLSELSGVALDYLYLISKIASKGAPGLLVFMGSNAYKLMNRTSLVKVIEGLEDPTNSILQLTNMNLTEDQVNNLSSVLAHLKPGYENTSPHKLASDRMLPILERGYSSVNPRASYVTISENNLNELLRGILSSAYFFTKDFDLVKTILIPRMNFTNYKPFDMLRFITNLSMQYLWPFIIPYEWLPLITKDDKQLRSHRSMNKETEKYSLSHQFSNLATSQYFGLIMSRLYQGSWLPEQDLQSFEFTSSKGSLGQYLQDQDTDNLLNVFVGSSYATHEMVRLCSHLKRSSRTRLPFKLFREGYLPEDSWTTASLELEAPSLAQEFPGGVEPNFE